MSPRGLVAAFSRFSRPARRPASHVRERRSGRRATRASHLTAELLESRCMLSATAMLENNISMFDRIPVIHGSQPANPGGSFVGQFFWNGSGFKSFCVEGQQSISPGLHTFPTVTSLSASGLANAGLVEQFWQSYGPTTPAGFTSVTDAAAFQLGLWELISDGPARDLKSGSFRVGDSASPAVARAASWLNGTGTPAPGAGGSVALHVMQHPTKQDQVIWGPLPPPSVSVKVTPTSVTEDSSKKLTYEFTASPAPTADITVNYRIGGSAQAGSDFTGLPQGATTGTITIPAGSTSATLTIVPTPDTEIEPDETVVITLQNGTGCAPGTSVATGTILNDDLPAVTLAVSPASVTEDGTTNLVYTFTRTGPTTSALAVRYDITGTADGADYSGATPGTGKTISFATGSDKATVTIDPTVDTTAELDETVILTLAPGSGYTIGTTTPVTGTIENDDLNRPPQFAAYSVPSNRQDKEGAIVSFAITATDPDGDSLTYAAANLPAGLAFNASTGLIAGKIAYTASGVHNTTITVTDSATPALSTTVAFTWTVADAVIDHVTGHEMHNGTLMANNVQTVGMSIPDMYVAPGNQVRLIAGLPSNLPTNLADVLYSVTGGASGTFATPPMITPHVGVVTLVAIGIDINQNGALDAGEKTHRLAIHRIKLDPVTFKSQRSAGPNAEAAAFEIRYQEHFEVGGTFDFTVVPGIGSVTGPSSTIRYELLDQDGFNDLLQEGTGLNFTYTFKTGVDEGDVFIRLYVDANGDNDYNWGEDYVDSALFWVQNVKVYEFGVWYSSALPGNPSADIAADMAYGNNILMSRDSQDDWRALVEMKLDPARSGASAHMFTAGASGSLPIPWRTPDPVLSADDAQDLFWAAPGWTIIAVNDFNGIRGLVESVFDMWYPWTWGGLSNELILGPIRCRETLAHEVGHLAGVGHDESPTPNHIVAEGTRRNCNAAKLLTQDNAREYDSGK